MKQTKLANRLGCITDSLLLPSVRKILGENVLRVFSQTLPPAGVEAD